MKEVRPAYILLLMALAIGGLWFFVRGRAPEPAPGGAVEAPAPSGPEVPAEKAPEGQRPTGTATHPLQPPPRQEFAGRRPGERAATRKRDPKVYDNEGHTWRSWCEQVVAVGQIIENLDQVGQQAEERGDAPYAAKMQSKAQRAREALDVIRGNMDAAGNPPSWAKRGRCQ